MQLMEKYWKHNMLMHTSIYMNESQCYYADSQWTLSFVISL